MSTPEEFTAELAADPATPAAVLAQIAQYRPDLLVALASNPSLYPSLRAWLSTSSDPRIHQALAWSAQQAGAGTPQSTGVPPVPDAQQIVPPASAQMPAAPQASFAQGSAVRSQVSGPTQVPPHAPPDGGTAQWASAPGQRSRHGRMKPAVLAAVVAVVALVIGGGAFAALRVFGGGGGYRSPDAVASALDKAISDKNLLALAGLVAPSERSMAESWRSALQDDSTDSEFDSQKLIGADALEEYVSAISVNSSRIEYTIEEEHDDLAVIDITSWTLDGALAPSLVSDMEQNYEEAKGSALTTQEQQAFDGMDLSEASFDGDVVNTMDGIPLRLVAVRENERWYLSVLMSAGEMLYREVAATVDLTEDVRMPVPDYGASFDESDGQSSAEGAVETVVERIDVERTLQTGGWSNPLGVLSLIDRADIGGLLSYPERRAALVYSPAFNFCAVNPEFQGCGGDELTQKQLSISWALDSEEVDGKRVVGAGTTSYVYSESEGSDDTTSVSFSGMNVSVKRESHDEVTAVDLAQGIDNPERIGIVSVEEDGKWVVSLGDTFANLLALKADSSPAQQVSQDGSDDDSSDDGVWTLLKDTPPYTAWTLIGDSVTEAARQDW